MPKRLGECGRFGEVLSGCFSSSELSETLTRDGSGQAAQFLRATNDRAVERTQGREGQVRHIQRACARFISRFASLGIEELGTVVCSAMTLVLQGQDDEQALLIIPGLFRALETGAVDASSRLADEACVATLMRILEAQLEQLADPEACDRALLTASVLHLLHIHTDARIPLGAVRLYETFLESGALDAELDTELGALSSLSADLA